MAELGHSESTGLAHFMGRKMGLLEIKLPRLYRGKELGKVSEKQVDFL